jgi:hypothetical protein
MAMMKKMGKNENELLAKTLVPVTMRTSWTRGEQRFEPRR